MLQKMVIFSQRSDGNDFFEDAIASGLYAWYNITMFGQCALDNVISHWRNRRKTPKNTLGKGRRALVHYTILLYNIVGIVQLYNVIL